MKEFIKKENEITKTISQILQFIESSKFLSSSLSILVNNLAEGICKIKCKDGLDLKNCKTCGFQNKDCDCFLKFTNFKDDLIKYKYLYCNKKDEN